MEPAKCSKMTCKMSDVKESIALVLLPCARNALHRESVRRVQAWTAAVVQQNFRWPAARTCIYFNCDCGGSNGHDAGNGQGCGFVRILRWSQKCIGMPQLTVPGPAQYRFVCSFDCDQVVCLDNFDENGEDWGVVESVKYCVDHKPDGVVKTVAGWLMRLSTDPRSVTK